MRHATTHRPIPAEQVRTACARTSHATLAVAGADPVRVPFHHLRANGTSVLAVPPTAAPTRPASAVVELTDLSPLPLREPVRALVWLRGTATAVDPALQRAVAAEVAAENPSPALLDVGHTLVLLRLHVDSAVLADTTGAAPVNRHALLHSSPDPFWQCEDGWLAHLDTEHADMVAMIAHRFGADQHGRARPLALDRHGITLRVEAPDGDRDVRAAFEAPVDDACSLSRALRVLVGCPFLNGLRAREH